MTTYRLEAAGLFDHRAALALLTAHAIPGVDHIDLARGTYTRLMCLARGPAGATVTFDDRGVDIVCDGDPDAGDLSVLRRWLDLDTDTRPIESALGSDPQLGPMVSRHPGLRVVGYLDEFEAVAMTVIGQQVSLAAARTFGGRLARAYGHDVGTLVAFPEPSRIASVDPAELGSSVGLTRARSATLHAVAEAYASGLTLRSLDPLEARAVLLAIPGVGRWTADYLAIRGLQQSDCFPSGDLVVRRALGIAMARDADRHAGRWAPWRSYATMQLWTHAAYLPPA